MNAPTETFTIDAKGQRLGRVASSIAALLMGKHRTDVARHKLAGVAVTVKNASKLLISERKMTSKEYQRYSGYPGGLRTLSMEKLVEQKGYAEVLRKAVYGMLPGNRLRAQRMKSLTIEE
jgi:large subunit ribosomal protein L13